jgi:hypothetical protein
MKAFSVIFGLLLCLWPNYSYADNSVWVPVVKQEVVYVPTTHYVPVVTHYPVVIYHHYSVVNHPVVYQYRPWFGFCNRPSYIINSAPVGPPTGPLVYASVYRY